MKRIGQSRCILIGLACAALTLCWQFLTVHYNYAGNWTALFCTGSNMRQPPQLASERIFVFANSNGYDGQAYHYIAHDPWLKKGLVAYVDVPRLRYRRILVPAIAHLLALGRDPFIDGAFIATNLIFVFLGVYWLGLWCVRRGWKAIWGAAFLLVPATLISIDRLTIDISLAALCVAFALFAEQERKGAVWPILAAAGLARETGLLLVAGYAAFLLLNGRWFRALLSTSAVFPALAWFAYVQAHTADYSDQWASVVPLAGWVGRILHPMRYTYGGPVLVAATLLDYAALAGMGIAIVLALRMARELKRSPAVASVVLFALLAIFISSGDVWSEVYSFGRVFTPLLLLLPLASAASELRLHLVPMALVSPRVGLQFGTQVFGVLRGFAGRRP